MKNMVLCMGLVALLLAASFCQATETINIAAIFAKTGDASTAGGDYFQAARFAVAEINQQGGLLGKQIKLFEFDNKSTPIDSKIAAQEAVIAGVVAAIGASRSSNSLAMAPIFQDAKIPMISPKSTNPQVTLVGDYIFRVCFIDPFQGAVMANFARRDLNAKTTLVFTNSNSSYSVGLAKVFIQRFQEQGGNLLWEGDYLDNETDFSFLLQRLKDLQPDVVFVPGYARDSAFIIKQARDLGLAGTFLGGDGWSNDMYTYAGDQLSGSYYSGHWHREALLEQSQQFVKRYAAQYGIVNERHALTYDAMLLLADAIRRADSLEPSRIRDKLAATKNFHGVTGTITLDANRDPVKSAVVLKLEQGASVFVKTIEP